VFLADGGCATAGLAPATIRGVGSNHKKALIWSLLCHILKIYGPGAAHNFLKRIQRRYVGKNQCWWLR
ncbi:hypothetical protein O5290_31155, partial [Escherichia coli]|nr:hypothetical protein [Escherichia coli]